MVLGADRTASPAALATGVVFALGIVALVVLLTARLVPRAANNAQGQRPGATIIPAYRPLRNVVGSTDEGRNRALHELTGTHLHPNQDPGGPLPSS